MQSECYLVIVNVPPGRWHAALQERVQLIGRGSDAEIRIPAEYVSVSRRHAEVWIEKGRLWLKDVGSRAGTRINGVCLEPHDAYQIRLGDRLWLGGVELEATKTLDPCTLQEDMASAFCETVNVAAQGITAELSPEVLLHSLTHAEQMVVLWMSRGYTSPERVAQKLCRSPHTVRTHLNNIFRKLGVHSREELLGWLARSNVEDDSGEFSDPAR